MTSLKKLAEGAKKISPMSASEAYETIARSISGIEVHLQMMIDTIVNIQDEWPMPKDGWRQFVEDIKRTNKKYGFNLQIKEK